MKDDVDLQAQHIQNALWNDESAERFSNDVYNRLLIEQYKIYSEMNDRTQIRRMVTNIFFLVFHGAVIGILGLSLSRQPFVPNTVLLLFPLLAVLVLCYAWSRVIKHFRRLCRVKEEVLKEMEARLPSTTFGAEHSAMMHPKPYNPLRKLEMYLPFIFSLLYIFSFCYVWYLSSGIHN
jgi:hypothetical protein